MKKIKVNHQQEELYIKKGYWSERSLLDCFMETVRKYPEREYVVDDRGKRYTYEQLDKESSKLARWLQEKGVESQDVVSLQLPTWSEFVLVSMACLKVAAIIHPIGLSQEEPDLIRELKRVNTKVYIAAKSFRNTDYEQRITNVMEELPQLQEIILLEEMVNEQGSFTLLEDILRDYQPLEEENYEKANGFEVVLILGTSGTTGGNKAVMLTHNNILFSEIYFMKELELDETDIMFMPAPLYHATGFHHGIIAPMLVGGKVVLQQRFLSKEAIELMNQEKCTFSMGATPFIYDILRCMEKEKMELPHLKFYLCGGAPIPGYMVQRADSYGIKLCEVYGSTESVPHVFVRPSEAVSLNGNTSGYPLPGVEIKVVDENGENVPCGEIGEEVSRGPNVFVGYVDDEAATNQVLGDDGWFYSGDLCKMDEKGYISIMGRKKDIIVRGGEKLNINEINDEIEGCPHVVDHAVVGMQDDRLGERICAFVVLKHGEFLELEDLILFMKERHVQKRYWPEHLETIDKIPRTGSGKVKAYLLKEELKRRGY